MPERPLRELDGEFHTYRRSPDAPSQPALTFTCPIHEPGHPDGHSIMVGWTAPSLFPSGAVWQKDGDTIDTVTITPSINCDVATHGPDGSEHPSSCRFHGWVRNGVVSW